MWGILVYQPWLPVNIRLLSPFLGVSAVVLPIYIYIYLSHLVVTFLGCQKDQIQIISNSQYMLFLLDLWKMSVFLCYHLSLCFLNKDSFPPLDGGVKCVSVESAAFRSP